MLRNGEPSYFTSFTPRLEAVRRLLREAGARSTGGLGEIRGEITDLVIEAAELPPISDFLKRLFLMTEVWECLPASGEARISLAGLCDEAIGRLLSEVSKGSGARGTSDWLIRNSDAAWGQYLVLLDGLEEGGGTEVPDPVPDLGLLLQLLTVGQPSRAVVSSVGATLGRVDPPGKGSVDHASVPLQGAAPVADAPRLSMGREAIQVVDRVPEPLDQEILDAFRADAEDLTERFESLAAELTNSGLRTELVLELGRCLHTLKGAAGAVGHAELVGRAHDFEERCDEALASPGGSVPDEFLDHLRGLLAVLESVLVRLVPTGQDDALPRVDDAPPLMPVGKPTEAEQDATGMIRVRRKQVDDLLDLVAELTLLNGPRGASAEKVKGLVAASRSCRNRLLVSIDRLCELSPELANLGPEASGSKGGEGGPLADVMSVVQSLSEQADDLALLAESARSAVDPLADESLATNRLVHQLWDLVHDVRIAPVRSLFQRLIGVAENAARFEGKRVEVCLEGADAGLDRAVQDRIYEPLLHVVRNAVAHGIEVPEVRVVAGKSPTGRVTIEARREGRSLTLTIRDDGRGLDYAAVEAKGRRLDLIAPGEKPGIGRLQALIFRPGFSTAPSADALSGRGIGMDVVARDVARLQGFVTLDSTPGLGMAVSIHLPERLSLEELLIVRIDGQAFALPLGLVDLSENRDNSICVEPAASPLTPKTIHARAALGLLPLEPTSKPCMVRVRMHGGVRTVAVDAIEGARELIVKPLNPLLAGHPAISGTMLSASGELVLLLDPVGIIRLAEMEARPGPRPRARGRIAGPGRVLVVDDSISVRRTMARHLRALGFEVEEAFDGVEALRRLRESSFGLILTDLQMPRMDGFELMAEVRRWAYPAPIVVASTRFDAETRRRAIELGARGFVAKPARLEDLAGVIGPLLNPPIESSALG